MTDKGTKRNQKTIGLAMVVAGCVALALVVGFAVGSASTEPEVEAAADTVASEATTTTALTATTTEATTTTTTPTTTTMVHDSGDWESVDAYRSDLQFTAMELQGVSESVWEAMMLEATGELTQDEFLHQMVDAEFVIQSQLEYLQGTVPPDGYAQAHGLTIQGINEFQEAIYLYNDSVVYDDLDLYDDGVAKEQDALETLGEATAHFPDSAG
jgi:hypothetical protein